MDYKKAWNKLKKALTANGDPLHLKGNMYMTSQQIANRTATIYISAVAGGLDNAEAKVKAITNTDGFKTFWSEVDGKSYGIEKKQNAYYVDCYYLRINY